MRYLTIFLEILAAVVAIAFGVGVLLGLGGRLTFAGLGWLGLRAKRADRPRERVPGPGVDIVARSQDTRASTTWRN